MIHRFLHVKISTTNGLFRSTCDRSHLNHFHGHTSEYINKAERVKRWPQETEATRGYSIHLHKLRTLSNVRIFPFYNKILFLYYFLSIPWDSPPRLKTPLQKEEKIWIFLSLMVFLRHQSVLNLSRVNKNWQARWWFCPVANRPVTVVLPEPFDAP